MHKLEMNRSFRNSVIGGGMNIPLASHHRRGLSFNGTSNGESFDDSLDLFSKSRRSVSVASSDDSDVSVKLGRLSVGSVMLGKKGLDDLLSPEEGKHDYDWLLTPPGTPLVPSSIGNESQQAQVSQTPRSRHVTRSVSATKTSRLSVSHSENSHPTRPTRSSSVTRPSVSTSQYSTYSNKSSNILNTSSASVSSYIRPSTPTRSSSSARTSTPTSRPTLSRPSTPPRPSQSSRSSTPSSRPQIAASLSSPASRSTSRSSTPTRRNSLPSISTASAGRIVSNGRTVASISRPSSPARTTTSVSRPSSPARRASQPVVPPDFSLETPSNLRTSLPDRPLSAGRSRPSSGKGAMEIPNAGNPPRRQSSPTVSTGRLSEPSGRGRVLANGHSTDVSKLPQRKPVRTPTESVGFGGTISKKSLDVAIRHMDIRNGPNGVRALSGSTLFPHSIRSNGAKRQQTSGSTSPASQGGSSNNMEKENRSEDERSLAKVTDVDIYESCRYDMLLMKEDVKNTNWLHSVEGKSDAMFDNGLEPLPEPFDPLLI